MRAIFALVFILVVSSSSNAQKIFLRESGADIDMKIKNALRYNYGSATKEDADFQLEVFFKGKYSIGKGYSAFYLLYDKSGEEIYRSKEWKAGGYGGVAENYFVKKIVEKDLPKVLSEFKK